MDRSSLKKFSLLGGFSAKWPLMKCSMMHGIWFSKVTSHHMIGAKYLTKRQKRGEGAFQPIWTNLRFRHSISIGFSYICDIWGILGILIAFLCSHVPPDSLCLVMCTPRWWCSDVTLWDDITLKTVTSFHDIFMTSQVQPWHHGLAYKRRCTVPFGVHFGSTCLTVHFGYSRMPGLMRWCARIPRAYFL